MNTLKLIVFVELIVMFVVAVVHLFAFLSKQHFELLIYPLLFVVTLACCLLSIYIFIPFAEWFF